MKIGIFWFIDDKIIGQKCSINEGEASVLGFIDSPFNHYESWELDPSFLDAFPHLFGSEYQTFPRGRVVYSKPENRFYIYLDKVLKNECSKKSIRSYFELGSQKIKWLSDLHYTTNENDLINLLN